MIRTALQSGLLGAVQPWTDNARDVVASSHVLLLPSRYEGLPLAMLEALSDGVPILASDIDVYRAYLPPSCRWDFVTPPGLAARLNALIQPDALAVYRTHIATLDIGQSARDSARLFEAAMLGEIPHDPATSATSAALSQG